MAGVDALNREAEPASLLVSSLVVAVSCAPSATAQVTFCVAHVGNNASASCP